MKCKTIGCKAYKEYDENGIIKRRCIISGKAYLLKESDELPLWCPRHMDPAIKQLLALQNEKRKRGKENA